MRTLVPRGVLGNNGDLISRVDKIDAGLKTGNACSRPRGYVNVGV